MGVIEQRYAHALADLVADPKAKLSADTVRRELDDLAVTMHESSALRGVLASPAVSWEHKLPVLEAVAKAAGISPIGRNFLLVVAQRGRITHLEGIVAAFDQLLLDRQGIVRADVASARTLSAGERDAIERELAAKLGCKLVTRWQIDPDLVGGFTARVGDQIFDGSIRGRLARLRQALTASN